MYNELLHICLILLLNACTSSLRYAKLEQLDHKFIQNNEGASCQTIHRSQLLTGMALGQRSWTPPSTSFWKPELALISRRSKWARKFTCAALTRALNRVPGNLYVARGSF